MRCGPGSARACSSGVVRSSAVSARPAGHAEAAGERHEVESGRRDVEHRVRPRAGAVGADPAAAPC